MVFTPNPAVSFPFDRPPDRGEGIIALPDVPADCPLCGIERMMSVVTTPIIYENKHTGRTEVGRQAMATCYGCSRTFHVGSMRWGGGTGGPVALEHVCVRMPPIMDVYAERSI